ncbi:hypothetical protein SDC9_159752 [bioreactor metagenome]|uniref:Uncharacterized protein n=1 Tax=bioreactor metagenome TaxID=1076179 RepID=A0A645FJ24_9ZZZZ
MRRSQRLRFSSDQRTAAVRWFDTENHLGRFGASGSKQSRQTDDLTRSYLEIERGDRPFLTETFERGHRFITQQGTPRTL